MRGKAGQSRFLRCASDVGNSAYPSSPLNKSLRYAVEHRQRLKPGIRYKRVSLVGILARVDANHRPGVSVEWCTLTKTGVVTTRYRLEKNGVWRFDGFHRAEARASGGDIFEDKKSS